MNPVRDKTQRTGDGCLRQPVSNGVKFKFLTLGCKVNQYETQGLKEKLLEFGFSESDKKADLYIINACTVTHRADVKSRQLIKRIKKENPQGKIAVCGCLPQLNPEAVEKIGVDYIVPQDKKIFLPEIVSGDLSESEISPKPADIWSLKITRFNNQRAFIKIQDGCSNFCSFCKIPYLRGPARSREPKEVIGECLRISQLHKEIVLCGVNLSLWGKDFLPHLSLAGLVRDILTIPSLGRLRLSSLEPAFVEKALISLFRESKLCPHVHFPFQYGDDKVLKAMNKKETVVLYEEKVSQLRTVRPDIALSCDIMVGFPEEDDRSFQNTVDFLYRLKPMRMHIFTFSPREKTKFAKLKLANPGKIKARHNFLKKMSAEFSGEYQRKFLGKTLYMVAEERIGSFISGYTENYLKVYAKGKAILGEIIPVRIDKFESGKVFATIIK